MPLYVRGPGLPAGRTSRELVNNTDLAATIADAAGVRPGLAVDGRSLLPYARDPEKTSLRPVLHEAGNGALPTVAAETSAKDDPSGAAAARGDLDQDFTVAQGRRPPGQGQVLSVAYEAIRTRRYLYVRYVKGERELYDYSVDPHELRSRHEDPAYAEVVEHLDRHLDQLQGCKGTACGRAVPAPPDPR
ncbi:DUF4976 domain-containing protein [Nonomuraea sp. K274]|uniref:DUF4976 domain-containing protein n=1 Tax=Nonomuraea cypriaca TaxID=1187855 RepID=A0A931A7X6_9ACTN|nr:DUF4976 domain-containing protein [Nonomuraea cypriaca]